MKMTLFYKVIWVAKFSYYGYNEDIFGGNHVTY